MMLFFRLLVVLGLFWNLSLVSCLVGKSRSAASSCTTRTRRRRRTIEGSSFRGHLLVGGLPTTSTAHRSTPKPNHPFLIPSSTVLGSTAESTPPLTIPGAIRVAWEFPSSKERFRNITRAIEYSIVYNDDENGEEQQQQRNKRATETEPERLGESKRHHWLASKDYGFVGRNLEQRIGTIGDKDCCPQKPAVVTYFPPTVDASESTTTASVKRPFEHELLFRRWLLSVSLAMTRILRSLSLWYYWFVGKTKSCLQRSLLRDRTNKGFSESDLGGTKRHYALLIASFATFESGYKSSNDPMACHRAIVQSAHQRTVASLSPSTLSFVDSLYNTKGIQISALQGHALKWSIRNRKFKTQLHRNQQKKQEQQG